MTLIVGLGNPGSSYEKNRHNIGFMVVDSIIRHLNPVKISKSSFKGELYKSQKLFFLKPMTYMNNSGESVVSVVNYYDIKRVIVVHDDIELPFGSIRIKHGGGNGGHNGLKSIDTHYGKEYDRIRVGISKPKSKEDVANYVLENFSKEQRECLDDIITYAVKTLEYLLEHNAQETATRYNIKQSLCEKRDANGIF